MGQIWFIWCTPRSEPVHRAASGPANDPTFFFEQGCCNPAVGINRREWYRWDCSLGLWVAFAELCLSGTPVRSVVDGSVVEYWTRPIVKSGMSWTFHWDCHNEQKVPVIYESFAFFSKMLHISIGFWRIYSKLSKLFMMFRKWSI